MEEKSDSVLGGPSLSADGVELLARVPLGQLGAASVEVVEAEHCARVEGGAAARRRRRRLRRNFQLG